MRRIIERTVTVVTTTTWKISWEPDAPPSAPIPDPVPDESPTLEGQTSSRPLKEEDPPDTETRQLQDEPSETNRQ